MAKAIRIFAFSAVIVVLAILAWKNLHNPHAPDPLYQDKHLSQWLEVSEMKTGHVTLTDEAAKAVRAIGTKAVPYLLQESGAQDSFLTKPPLNLGERFPKLRFIRSANTRRLVAFRGILALRDTAVPGALAGLTNADSQIRLGSEIALTLIGKTSPAITHALLQRLKDDNEPVRAEALVSIAVLGRTESQTVVPAIMESLNDKDPRIQEGALYSLGLMGDRAKPAVPVLVKMLNETNHPSYNQPYILTNTLRLIDPEAAAKVGIK